jgi:hypothetical protein
MEARNRSVRADSLEELSLGELRTLYKWKEKKVLPVDQGYASGERPRGDDGWRERRLRSEVYKSAGQFEGYIIPKFSGIVRGMRLMLS